MPAHVLPRLGLATTLCLALAPGARAQETIPGVESWAEATVGLSTTKWVGPRVPYPLPTPRPAESGRLDSLLFPLSVHVGPGVPAARALRVLRAVEELYPLLEVGGFVEAEGDAGGGGTGARDLYVVANAAHGANAGADLTQPFGPYDGARAFAIVDARTPEAQVDVCTAQALVESLLFELDPAEAPSVRKASAAYTASLLTEQLGCDDDAERALERPEADPFGDPESAGGALWLARLSARQDRGSGVLVRELWDFARQRTWEGRDLRASPDLFECLAQYFEVGREELEHVAGELAEQRYLAPFPLGVAPARPHVLRWSALPAREIGEVRTIEQLGASYAWVALEQPRPGEQLKVWSRGELGTRWTLIATRLDAQRNVVGRVSAPARHNPNSFVVMELDARTTDVLISVTNVADGIPDADLPNDFFDHGVEIVVDRGQGTAGGDEGERPVTIGVGPR